MHHAKSVIIEGILASSKFIALVFKQIIAAVLHQRLEAQLEKQVLKGDIKRGKQLVFFF